MATALNIVNALSTKKPVKRWPRAHMGKMKIMQVVVATHERWINMYPKSLLRFDFVNYSETIKFFVWMLFAFPFFSPDVFGIRNSACPR